MIIAETPKNEKERIENLHCYNILDTEKDPAFDAITKMAGYIFDAPIGLVSLVDTDRQWFKSNMGLADRETPRDISFCSHAILTPDQPLVVNDASSDPRFADNPLVTSGPEVRFYAGSPIITEEGFPIGTLCVIDTQPRTVTNEQLEHLTALASQVSELLSLRKQKNEFETLSLVAEKSSNVVIITDAAGITEYVNNSFEQLTGYTAEEAIGKKPGDLLQGPETDPEHVRNISEALKRQEHIDQAILNYTKSGKPYWIRCAISPVFDHSDNLTRFIAVESDITEIKEKEQALELANEQALESVKMKEQFLSNMSHEIRTPMNGIIGMSQILMDEDNLPEKQAAYVQHINYAAGNLLNIINDILDFSKINAEKITFEQANFDLHQLFRELEKGLGMRAAEKGIDFQLILDNKLPKFVSGDQSRLNQILYNLAGNALKFTELGGVNVEVNLKEYNENGPVIDVTITDTGVGIPEDKLETIFEDFQQASDYISSKYGGTGLGMSIAKKLIERSGGKLTLESEEGVGTRCMFSVCLHHPIFDTSDLHNQSHVSKTETSGQKSAQEIHVLLAEDNYMNQVITRTFLEKDGYQVDIAENGLKCLELYEANHYDIILMDVQMPEMNGLDATKKIRETNTEIPILALTASVMEHDKKLCYDAGMNETVSKPVKSEVLNNTLQQYLHSYQSAG